MSVIQIIVPVTHDKLHLLEDCLQSVKRNTPVDHIVNVVVGNAHIEDRVGEVVSIARSVYNRTGLIISCAEPDHGYNGIVFDALRVSDHQFTVVLPSTHRIEDDGWFGKMQLPQIRAPSCAMTFAPDDMEANTRASHPWDWRFAVPSKFFMLQRNAIGTIKGTHIDSDGTNLASAIRDQLRTVGANAWAVPSCRVVKMHAEW